MISILFEISNSEKPTFTKLNRAIHITKVVVDKTTG